MKIYTKTGDDGTTGLYGGARVSKGSPRVEAYGNVDEANAAVGFSRAARLEPAVESVLAKVQSSLFDVGARLATPPEKAAKVPAVTEDDVRGLESAIDALETSLPPLKTFVLPGGSEQAARLHLARTVVRRAERAVIRLAATEPVEPVVIRYLNRLSDLLFVQARSANRTAGVPDVPWAPRKT